MTRAAATRIGLTMAIMRRPDAGDRERTGMAGQNRAAADRRCDTAARPGRPRGVSLPGDQGQVGDLVIERTHGRQQLRDPAHPGPALAPGPCGTAQLLPGQQPQVSFRPRTVHLLSVPGPRPRCQRPADVDTFPGN